MPSKSKLELELDKLAVSVDALAKKSYRKLLVLIESGVPPREALDAIYLSFQKGTYSAEYLLLLSKTFTTILQKPFSVQQVMDYRVGKISLSSKLYQDNKKIALEAQIIIENHAKAIINLRALSLDLYSGYGQKSVEVFKLKNVLPKYLLNATKPFASDFEKEVAKLIAKDLRTAPLRAAYSTLLDRVESGASKKALQKAVEAAMHEKIRWKSTQVASQEIARAYSKQQALKIRARNDIQYVEVRYSGSHRPDLCNLFGDVDRFNIRQGVYPKDEAPVPPYHVGCRCRLISLVNLETKDTPTANLNAEQDYLNSLSKEDRLKLLTRGTRDYIENGGNIKDYVNARTPEEYRIKTIKEIA